MKYTNYFSSVIKEQGRFNLDTCQFQRFMNIVYVEGVITGLMKIKESIKDSPEPYKYDLLIFRQDKTLTELTGNLEPNELIMEMMELSE